jgi:hypothetical protein
MGGRHIRTFGMLGTVKILISTILLNLIFFNGKLAQNKVAIYQPYSSAPIGIGTSLITLIR